MGAGDDPGAARRAWQCHRRNLAGGDALVARGCHLVLGRQVDPELDHLEAPTPAGEVGAVELLVQDPRGRRHPLHVAGADGAAATRGVAMGDAAGIDDGDRLEAPVRMLTDAEFPVRRWEVGRTGIVQQQEGGQFRADILVGKDAAYRKAITHPVPAITALDAGQLFQDCLCKWMATLLWRHYTPRSSRDCTSHKAPRRISFRSG